MRTEGLQKLVVDKRLDVGFVYDGDADRCFSWMRKEMWLSGPYSLYMPIYEGKKLLTNIVVTTVMPNFGLYKVFDGIRLDYVTIAVSDKYVYEYLVKNGCRIGGVNCLSSSRQ